MQMMAALVTYVVVLLQFRFSGTDDDHWNGPVDVQLKISNFLYVKCVRNRTRFTPCIIKFKIWFGAKRCGAEKQVYSSSKFEKSSSGQSRAQSQFFPPLSETDWSSSLETSVFIPVMSLSPERFSSLKISSSLKLDPPPPTKGWRRLSQIVRGILVMVESVFQALSINSVALSIALSILPSTAPPINTHFFGKIIWKLDQTAGLPLTEVFKN